MASQSKQGPLRVSSNRIATADPLQLQAKHLSRLHLLTTVCLDRQQGCLLASPSQAHPPDHPPPHQPLRSTSIASCSHVLCDDCLSWSCSCVRALPPCSCYNLPVLPHCTTTIFLNVLCMLTELSCVSDAALTLIPHHHHLHRLTSCKNLQYLISCPFPAPCS